MNDCPPDLEEIGRDDEDTDYRFPSALSGASLGGVTGLNDTYGEKTIDEDEMEAYFNGKDTQLMKPRFSETCKLKTL